MQLTEQPRSNRVSALFQEVVASGVQLITAVTNRFAAQFVDITALTVHRVGEIVRSVILRPPHSRTHTRHRAHPTVFLCTVFFARPRARPPVFVLIPPNGVELIFVLSMLLFCCDFACSGRSTTPSTPRGTRWSPRPRSGSVCRSSTKRT